jgi:hypothetical protein
MPESLPDGALKYSWKIKVAAPARDVWRYLADTSKMYRAAFMPKRHLREEGGKLFVKQKLLFLREEWVEEPWTWVAGRSINIKRTYLCGMGKLLNVNFEVVAITEDQSQVIMSFGWIPKNFFWRLLILSSIPLQKFVAGVVLRKIEKHLHTHKDEEVKLDALKYERRSLARGGFGRLSKIHDSLLKKGLSPKVIEPLCEWVSSGDELDVYRLQVKPLAKRWKVRQRDLLTA